MFTLCSIRFYSDLFCRGSCFNCVICFIYAYWCQTRFPYQAYMLFTIVTIGVTRGTGTAYRSETHTFTPLGFVEFALHTLTPVVLWSPYYICLSPLCCGVRITLSIVSLCASFELWSLIIPFVSS
jgi:hypothetical protein